MIYNITTINKGGKNMGLDMYLYLQKNDYVSDFTRGVELEYPTELKELEEYIQKANFRSVETTTRYQVGYWRKFNALHSWIVEKLADGKDKCQPIKLTVSNVEELINICEKLLKDRNVELAKELLPTKDGDFFGSLEYDEWYFHDVLKTYEILNKVLQVVFNDRKSLNPQDYTIVYQASW
jgi:hypothetical protein